MKIKVSTIEDSTFKFIILYSIVPIIARAVSAYLTTYSYMLIVVLTVFLIVFANGKKSFNIYASLIMPFLLFELLTYFTTYETMVMWGYQVLLFLMPVIIGYFILQNKSYMIDTLSLIIILSVSVTILTTINGAIQYPNAARTLATVDSGKNEYAVLYSWKNIGGYNFVYTAVLLYPMLILAFKEKRISLILTVAGAVGIFALAIYTEYTIAMLLVLLSSSLFFFKRDLKASDLIVLAVVGMILVLLFSSVLSDAFDWLSNTLGSEKMSLRFDELSQGKTGLENSDDNRLELYMTSINTFLSHPFFGTFLGDGKGAGGHAFILDSLAHFGLIGGACMWCMYRKIYRVFIRPFCNMKGYGYILWAFIQGILLSSINTGAWLEVLALYIPLIAVTIYKKDIEEMKNESIVDS